MLPKLPSLEAMPSSSGSRSVSRAVTALPGCVQRRASLAKPLAQARISALAGRRGTRASSVPCVIVCVHVLACVRVYCCANVVYTLDEGQQRALCDCVRACACMSARVLLC